MKTFVSLAALLAANQVAGHATFQQLWVGGTDFGSQCVRLPLSNSPVTSVSSNDIRCNANQGAVPRKCPVAAGDSVTVEMHQQNGDRSCGSEAIGGAHYGPVMVYLSKVPDATKADGSTPFYKIYQGGWSKAGAQGDDDNWAVKDMNKCCGKVQIKIPADTPAGDYLLRAEVIALHSAGGSGGAQFYISCYQISVTGGSGSTPAGVSFPGAYKATDPGILVNIHSAMSSYVIPGPAVVASGTTKPAGSACTGCESTCKVGSAPVGTAISVPGSGGGDSGGGDSGCQVPKFQQCGGTGYTGCTKCQSGSTCSPVSAPHYYQCT